MDISVEGQVVWDSYVTRREAWLEIQSCMAVFDVNIGGYVRLHWPVATISLVCM